MGYSHALDFALEALSGDPPLEPAYKEAAKDMVRRAAAAALAPDRIRVKLEQGEERATIKSTLVLAAIAEEEERTRAEKERLRKAISEVVDINQSDLQIHLLERCEINDGMSPEQVNKCLREMFFETERPAEDRRLEIPLPPICEDHNENCDSRADSNKKGAGADS